MAGSVSIEQPCRSRKLAHRMVLACFAMLVALSVGCERAGDLQFVAGAGISELEPSEQEGIRQALRKWCGTPLQPKMMDATSPESEELTYGASVYQRNCVQCHGVSGDGNGQAGEYSNTPPTRLSPRHLQIHVHALWQQATPRGSAANRHARNSRHVDAVVPPLAEARSGGRGRLRVGTDASWRVGDLADRASAETATR